MKRSLILKYITISYIPFLFSCFDVSKATFPTATPTATAQPSVLPGTPVTTSTAEFLWTKNNIKFRLPADIKETKNDDTGYLAETNGFRFELLEWAAQKLTQDDILAEGMKNINADKASLKIDNKNTGTIIVNNMSGFIVSATAKDNGVDYSVYILTIRDAANVAYISTVKIVPSQLADNKSLNVISDIFNTFMKNATPSPSPSSSASIDPNASPTVSPSTSPDPSVSISPSVSVTPQPTITPSVTVTAST